MTLGYYHFQCLLYVITTFLMSALLQLKYLMFTKSKLLSLFSCSVRQGSSSAGLHVLFFTPQSPMVLLLFLHHLADCLQMVGFATTTPHLTICSSLPLWVPCSTIFAVLLHLFAILSNITMCLFFSCNRVEFLCISYIAQHLFLHSLILHSLCPHEYLVRDDLTCIFLRLFTYHPFYYYFIV